MFMCKGWCLACVHHSMLVFLWYKKTMTSVPHSTPWLPLVLSLPLVLQNHSSSYE